jgi:hypothetical protein
VPTVNCAPDKVKVQLDLLRQHSGVYAHLAEKAAAVSILGSSAAEAAQLPSVVSHLPPLPLLSPQLLQQQQQQQQQEGGQPNWGNCVEGSIRSSLPAGNDASRLTVGGGFSRNSNSSRDHVATASTAAVGSGSEWSEQRRSITVQRQCDDSEFF